MRARLWLPALLLAGCASAPVAPRLVLGPSGATATLTIAAARRTQALAHAWDAQDVYEYDVALKRYDVASGAYVDLPTPVATTLPQKPAPQLQATFAGLQAGQKYEAIVVARGNASGTASDTVLNAAHPATAAIDLSVAPPQLSPQVTVQLDDVPFDVTIALPSNAASPGSVPKWVTQLDARLQDASGTPALVASYTPSHTAEILHARAGVHYALTLTVHSATGQTTATVPDLYVPRVDGTEASVTPSFPPFTPPTGTLLATYNLGVSSFGIAVDAQDHLWITNQHDNTVSELNTQGQRVATPAIAVGNQPRGIAVDAATGIVWVANFYSSSLMAIATGGILGTYGTGFFPGGVAVDAQHRVWTADYFSDDVTCLTASGTAVAGSPFAVGSSPSGIAVDAGTGDVWVANTGGNSVNKISAAGVVSGPFPVGVQPGGIAVDAQHGVWVANDGDGTVSHLKPDGSAAGPPISVAAGLTAIAINPLDGGIWVLSQNGDFAEKLASDGTLIGGYPTGGVFPSTLAFDKEHHVWITGGGSLAELAP